MCKLSKLQHINSAFSKNVFAFTATEIMGQERVFNWGRKPKVSLQRGLPYSPPPLFIGAKPDI